MAVVLVIVTAIALHHSETAVGAMHDDHGMSGAIEMCLGVMTAVGTAVVLFALAVLTLGHWPQAPTLMAAGFHARPPVPRARAGPLLLCLLCVSRR